MQVTVENGEGLERRMTVELPAEDINKEVESRLKQLSKTVRMPGFRPGKVPMKIMRTRYGTQVQQEVFGDKVQSSFSEAVKQQQLRPAGMPRIEPDLAQGQGESRYAYTAVFDVLPEIELAAPSDAAIERPVAEVTDDDVDEMIGRLRKQRVTWNAVEREARDGDQLTISFVGKMDGEAFEGGTASDVPLELGSGAMIKGFEEGLLGASAGDKRDLELSFPDGYHVEHLAGKPAVFEVEVTKVAEPALPELDADFAKAFGVQSGDLEQFRADIRGNMERELRQRIQAGVKAQAMEALLSANPLDVPSALVEEEITSLMEQTRQNAGGRGMELPRNLFEDEASKRVKLGLLVAEVVKQKGIQLDQDRLQSTIEEMAATYEDPQQVIDFYTNNRQQRSAVENLVLEDQVVDWVLGEAQVTDVTKSFLEVTDGRA
jgi:trigger factor